MAASAVYEGDIPRMQPPTNSLFAGQKLWFSQGVPQRQWLIQNAQLNGAEIVSLDKQADIRLVDHARKNQAPGTHSYRYVEASIRNGKLEDLDAHRVGSTSRVDRPVGSIVTASKGSRNKFTSEDDQVLWNWMKPYVDAGGTWKGNDIYKQLERHNPRHTFQSWRDRWIKYVQYQARQITQNTGTENFQVGDYPEHTQPSPKRRKLDTQPLPVNAPQAEPKLTLNPSVHGSTAQSDHRHTVAPSVVPNEPEPQTPKVATPRTQQHQSPRKSPAVEAQPVVAIGGDGTAEARDSVQPTTSQPRKPTERDESTVTADHARLPLAFNFTQFEARMLYKATRHILRAHEDKLDESWASVAHEYKKHSKEVWMKFFYNFIVPEYKRRHGFTSDAQLQRHIRKHGADRKSAKKLVQPSKDVGLSSSSESEDESSKEEKKEACIVCQHLELKIHLRGQAEGRRVCIDCLRNLTLTDLPPLPPARDADQTDRITTQASTSTAISGGRHDPPNASQRSGDRPGTDPDSGVSALFRPPQPNESRKLSQSRGSQSTQTQSQSQSNSNSQPLQRTQTLSTLRQEAAVSSFGRVTSEMQALVEDIRPQHSSSIPISRSDRTQERHDDADRFITQSSLHEHKADPEKVVAVPVGQMNETTQISEESDTESYVMVSEGDGEDSQSSSDDDSTEHAASEQLGSQPFVQLVDPDDNETGREKSSDHSHSETTTEAVQVDGEMQLSHAWETAPEQVADASVSEADDGSESVEDLPFKVDDQAAQLTQAAAAAQSSAVPNAVGIASDEEEHNASLTNSTLRDQSKSDEFETAPTHENTQSGILQHGSRIETQALFNQPTQADFTQLVAIPAPPGGWDEEEEDEDVAEDDPENDYGDEGDRQQAINNVADNQSTSSDRTIPHQDADWTLPLPDPEPTSVPDPTPKPETETEVTDNEIELWLQSHTTSHPHVPKYLLKPLSHRALESTSMDLHLATEVFDRMLRALDLDANAKGKRPESAVSQAVQDLRYMTRVDRIRAVSELIDDAVPKDLEGCWTREDDAALLGVDGRDVKRAEDKHGEEAVKQRFEFLALWHD